MHFAAATNESIDVIWGKIVHAVNGSLSAVICPNASSFITTKDFKSFRQIEVKSYHMS